MVFAAQNSIEIVSLLDDFIDFIHLALRSLVVLLVKPVVLLLIFVFDHFNFEGELI